MAFSLKSLRVPFFSAGTRHAVHKLDDSMDFRPVLDAITNEIQKRSGSGRLIVLTSERHDAPAHIMLHQALMGRFLNKTPKADNEHSTAIASGLELEHNQLDTIIERAFKIAPPDEVRGKMSFFDTDAKNLFRAFRAIGMPAAAPASFRNRMAFLEARRIPLSLNDVANQGVPSLDLKDGKTRRIVTKYAPQSLGEAIEFYEPFGLSLRNRMIFENAQAHIEKTGANIYFQNCGRTHLLGRKDSKHQFSDSLTARFHEAGYNVLPIFPADRIFETSHLPTAAKKILASGFTIENLDSRGYGRNDWDREISYLEQLRDRTDGAFEIFPDEEPKFRTPLFEQVKQEAPAWIEAAQRSLSEKPEAGFSPKI